VLQTIVKLSFLLLTRESPYTKASPKHRSDRQTRELDKPSLTAPTRNTYGNFTEKRKNKVSLDFRENRQIQKKPLASSFRLFGNRSPYFSPVYG